MAPELHFQELASILRRRRGVVIAIAVIGTTLVFFGSLMIPPQYTAKAQIVPRNRLSQQSPRSPEYGCRSDRRFSSTTRRPQDQADQTSLIRPQSSVIFRPTLIYRARICSLQSLVFSIRRRRMRERISSTRSRKSRSCARSCRSAR